MPTFQPAIDTEFQDPYFLTDIALVEYCLHFADLQKGETFFDLGSGDGRAVRLAAKKFKARGIGVEVSAENCENSRKISESEGLSESTSFRCESYFDANLLEADVVYIYLTRYSMGNLSWKLEKELRPGTRIVTHTFDLPGFDAELKGQFISATGEIIPVYRYLVK